MSMSVGTSDDRRRSATRRTYVACEADHDQSCLLHLTEMTVNGVACGATLIIGQIAGARSLVACW